jgi:hypothetical protein
MLGIRIRLDCDLFGMFCIFNVATEVCGAIFQPCSQIGIRITANPPDPTQQTIL